MEFKPGLRLRSQVCTTEVIVVRPSTDDIDLQCGGAAMVAVGTQVTQGVSPAEGLDSGTLLGKRYTTEDLNPLELLVTKQGAGTLTSGGTPLVLKEAKPLPSSD